MVVCIGIKACRARFDRFDSQNLRASQEMFIYSWGTLRYTCIFSDRGDQAFLCLLNFDLGTCCWPAIFWPRVFGVRKESSRDLLGAYNYPSVLDVC